MPGMEMFPGRRGAGRIFYNQVKLSGKIPQICVLFGPSAAGGAYIPAFCDIVIMVDKNASMYLGSPRMAESVIGEKVTLEEMGGAKMHCSISGCGDMLVNTEEDAIRILDVTISTKGRSAVCNGKDLKLTPMEFSLLLYLAKMVNKGVSREELLNRVWGYESEVDTRATDDMIKRIRKKLINSGSLLKIETLWGFGFIISNKD